MSESKLELTAPPAAECGDIFSDDALAFVGALTARFGRRRDELLAARAEAGASFDGGAAPDFFADTAEIRDSDWRVAEAPPQIADRRVEITGPADRKMMINALNSPALVFMADMEDSLSPAWEKVCAGYANLRDAARGAMAYDDPASGKHYALNPEHDCALMVRPRGWHLPEKHIIQDGKPAAAALCDAGFFLFHAARELKARRRGVFLYLPKIEHWREAELWDDALAFAEKELRLTPGEIKTTVLIETLPAVFQMHEILHALKARAAGLNCGRWDYIFSFIKTFRAHPDRVLPERNRVTMTAPFLRAYSRLLIQTCHRRGAHAMGGMAAFIPIKNDQAANAEAFAKVRADKRREAQDGHDGTWVAHPGLIQTAREVFDEVMPGANQKDVFPPQAITGADLLEPLAGEITPQGFDGNIQAAARYIASWLGGDGAAPIFNLMEDAATAEIARAQLWQWIKYPAGVLSSGEKITAEMFKRRLAAAQKQIGEENPPHAEHLGDAAGLLTELVLAGRMADFLTLAAYPRLP